MAMFRVVGAGGRLGSAVFKSMSDIGHSLSNGEVNYLIFAHRYRGPPDYGAELDANVGLIVRTIDSTHWADGDKSIVIVSSICAENPVSDQPISYNVSKAAQLQVARYYAKKLPGIRCNTVSPAAFTGANPVVSIKQVVDVISFLCSEKSSGINGEDIKICN